jgi:hypothetical protein
MDQTLATLYESPRVELTARDVQHEAAALIPLWAVVVPMMLAPIFQSVCYSVAGTPNTGRWFQAIPLPGGLGRMTCYLAVF